MDFRPNPYLQGNRDASKVNWWPLNLLTIRKHRISPALQNVYVSPSCGFWATFSALWSINMADSHLNKFSFCLAWHNINAIDFTKVTSHKEKYDPDNGILWHFNVLKWHWLKCPLVAWWKNVNSRIFFACFVLQVRITWILSKIYLLCCCLFMQGWC